MDNTRLFLVIALSFVSLMLWDAWQRDYNKAPVSESSKDQPISTDAAPKLEAINDSEAPNLEASPLAGEPSLSTPSLLVESVDATVDTVSIRTDVLELEVNLLGGGIAYAGLPKYPVDLARPEEHFSLLDRTHDRFFIHQGGMKGNGETPNHRSQFQVSQANYELGDGAKDLIVDLFWSSGTGMEVIKRFTFQRGSYVIGIEYLIDNKTSVPWEGRVYEQLQRAKPRSKRTLIYTFTGAAISTPDKRYEKLDFDDLDDAPLNFAVKDGWVGILEHYFVSALVPPAENLSHFYSLILDETRYVVGYWSPPMQIPAGGGESVQSSIFIGPKLQDVLEKVAPGLELTVDFGVLWFIAKPLFVILQFIKDTTGNWGWAIIILTCLLKLVFYPLSAAGYRSMANMRKVQPRMVAMKERYGKDRAGLNQAMMALYKEEKINPLGGCLPILVQIPVFISLYWVLLESVELRQAPFALWLVDLTSKDPFFILPLIMGVSMWIQQKLNPAPMDPVQQKVMQILPFAFTIFFMFFPSGLVLYWVVNNILSIAQQWHITRNVENEQKA